MGLISRVSSRTYRSYKRTKKNNHNMGAYKYQNELWRKKQSDVMKYILRLRAWHLRQLPAIHRASRPSRPEKARLMGCKAKQGYVVYRVRVRRGCRKRLAPKGATYGKPVHEGVNQLKFQRRIQSVAEERAGKAMGGLRVVNSYWAAEDSTYKYYEVVMVDPQHKVIRRDADMNWIAQPVHKHRELKGLTSAGKKIPRRRQRSPIHTNHWWLQAQGMEKAKHPPASPKEVNFKLERTEDLRKFFLYLIFFI